MSPDSKPPNTPKLKTIEKPGPWGKAPEASVKENKEDVNDPRKKGKEQAIKVNLFKRILMRIAEYVPVL